MILNSGVSCHCGHLRNKSKQLWFNLLSALCLLGTFAALANPPPSGVAPVLVPIGGFGIDGDLMAGTPLAGVGDWLPGTNTVPGCSVLDSKGNPINPATTFHFVDGYSGGPADLVFVGGLKWTDDPNTWGWTSGKASSKTDINNVLVHIAADTSNHIWVIIAADRASTSGDSYIDFEFLQNTLTRNANGTFTSAGTNGGRTTGDLLLSLAFSGGGSTADFFAWRWLTNGSGGFAYADVTGSLPQGRVFVALNSNNIAVPYGAFGSTNYAPNAFAEAAVDLTALLATFDQCSSFGFKTIMVKTKSSQSSSSTISDFIDPIQYKLKIGPSSNPGTNQALCTQGLTTDFPLQGTATGGLYPVSSTLWTVVAGIASVDDPASLATTAHVSSASATLRLTVTESNGCSETNDVVLSVNPLPACSITGTTQACPNSLQQFSAPAGMGGYLWAVSGSGVISGATNAQTVTVQAGLACSTNYTLTLMTVSNGCVSICSDEVVVNDTVPPVISCPGDKVLQCPADTRTNVTGVATAQDGCGYVTVNYSDSVSNTCGGARIIWRTWTAYDLCGNVASCVQTITVVDTTPPKITCPTNLVLECPADTSTNATGVATATDTCSSVSISYSDSVTNNCGGTKVIARTWTAIDGCGNAASCVQTITVRDTTPPSIICPTNVTVECPGDTSTNSTGVATALDGCGATTISFVDSVTNLCGNTKVIRRTWTAADACGNKASCVQTIAVVDTTPPVITCPADAVLECPATDTSTNVTGAATAVDGCGAVTIKFSDAVVTNCGAARVITRTWTATDACGNKATCAQKITVQDTTPPNIVCPANITLECPATNTSPSLTGTATATDGCGSVSVGFSDAVSTNCGAARTISRTWTATDACGNKSSCIQTITVRDTTPPTITCPTNVILECPANDTSTNITGTATAKDGCGAVTIGYTDGVTTNCGAARVILRTWTATDACGNTSTCVQTITVRDTTPPNITCPTNVVLECPADTSTNHTGAAVAIDGCGNTTISYLDSVTNLCGGTKIISRTWTAADACGNKASCIQTITVVDTTPPVITCPADVVLECPATDTSTNVTGAATAVDGCGAVTIKFSDAVVTNCGAARVITRTWTATDACGNKVTCAQKITVQDTTPPTIVCPTNVVLECPATNSSPSLTGTATATDGCGSVSIAFSDSVSTNCGAARTISRTWTATDACGNKSSCVQTITVRDTTPPSITCPANLTLECPATNTSTNLTGTATATDGCGAVTLRYSDSVTTNCGAARVIQRMWTATDACGNVSSCVQTITVRDTTPPTIQCPTNVVLECPANTSTNNTGVASAQDGCGAVTVAYSDVVSNNCGGTEVIFRTWTATDACGNKSSCIQTITVRDTTPPVVTCPQDRTLECPADTSTNNTGVATAVDGCSATTITYSDAVTNLCANTKVIARTWTATDACGNKSSCVQTIRVVDTTPPVITCAGNKTVQCGTAWTFDTPTATDGCGTNSIALVGTVTNATCGSTFVATRTWRATDACGNSSQCSQVATIVDTTPPVIVCPANITIECPAAPTTNITGVATATDTCNSVTVTYSDSSVPICGNARTISRTWRATDACGNVATCVQTITVRDTTPPTISIPPNVVVECGNSTAPSATGTATAQDTCNSVTVTYNDVATNNCGLSKVISRTWTATDACGNSTNGVQIITVRDTTPPRLTLPANLVLGCPGDTRTNVTGVPTAVDGCGTVTISYSDTVSNTCAQTRTVQRLWTAIDQCGNATNGIQIIIVQDTAPRIACPAVSVQCVADIPTPYSTLAGFLASGGTATDSCDTNPVFALMSDTGLVGRCPGTVTRVYRVTDVCGLYSECTQVIHVDDTIAPVLKCPTNSIVECGMSLDPTNAGMATATDNCTTNVKIAYTDSTVSSSYNLSFLVADPDTGTGPYGPTYLKFAPGSLPCPNEAVFTGRALDPLRNAVAFAPNGQQDALTSIGNVPMAFGQIVPYEVVIQAGGGPGPERGTIDFTADWHTYTTSNDRFGYDTNYMVYCAFVDAADPGSIDPNYNARVVSYSSTVVNPGTINEAIRGTFRVTGIDSGDRIVVEIWVVLDSSMTGNAGGTVASKLVSAQTVSDPPVQITVGNQTDSLGNLGKIFPMPAPQPQPPLGPLPPQPPALPGSTISQINRTWTATDDCGNQSSCVQQILVRDTTPPVLTVPPDVTLSCPADTSTNNTGSAVAVDGCGWSILFYSDVVSNSCGGSKTLWRTWTAIDQSGLTNTAVQTITVLTPPPSLVCQSNRTVVAGAAWTFDDPTASDTCSTFVVQPIGTVTNATATNTVIATRTWQATDSCGNSSICQQSITVLLQSAPVIVTQPVGGAISIGGNEVLSVGATGTGPMSYQWKLNGANISGATRSQLTMNPIQFTNAGSYSVVVSNAGGAVASGPALVNVAPILVMSWSNNLLKLTWSGPFVLQSSSSPAGPYSDIPGATSPYFVSTATQKQAYFRLRSNPFRLTATSSKSGQFSVSCPGVPGCNFIIQASTDLVSWSNLQTNSSPFTFSDPSAATIPRRFYRAVLAH
jgi:hypothetical protein